MKLKQAVFEYDQARVSFKGNTVRVWVGGVGTTLDNTDRRYKPCATHCEDLIRQALAGERLGKNQVHETPSQPLRAYNPEE